MFALGHIGITLGVVSLIHNPAYKRSACPVKVKGESGASYKLNPGSSVTAAGHSSPVDWLIPRAKRLDYRILLLGSLLPDIVDKTIGVFAFSNSFSNGRILSHTLLFTLLLGIAGLYLYSKSGRTNLLTLALGSGMHLLFDGMWSAPETLFWPLFGWEFPKIEISNWLWRMLHQLLTEPGSYVPELIGAIIIAILAVRLVQLRQVKHFLQAGRID